MRLFGHPLHAVLVAFPLGLLSLTPLWDGLAWLGVGGAGFAAYFGEIAGLAFGALSVVTGCVDFVRLQKSEAVEKLALTHAGAALSSLCIFAVALALREKDHSATTAAMALEAFGALSLGVTGWCGGHLVFHHGVGVQR